MAIFDKKVVKKVLLDDTQTISCFIENSQTINGHTEYILRIQRGPIRNNNWKIYKRYNDFVELHHQLQSAGITSLSLPPKKIFGNMSREFISERQQALQHYINQVLMNPILASSLSTKRFVDPNNYSISFQEVALQHVSLALRGEVGWEVVCPLSEVGWRLRKNYFQVRRRSNSKVELIASWVEYGPDKQMDEKDIQYIFKSLQLQLQHPYIYPMELAVCTETGGLVVRKSCKNGSLRDLICGAKPKQSFMKKYGNSKCHKPLSESQIALYGRQILEVLNFLHEKGIPYGHLHTGNIFIESDDLIKIVDIENGVLGIPSYYRPFIVQHKRISSLESIDVYSFGHTIYEMVFGTPLYESVCDQLPSDCPAQIRSLLESILSSEGCKNGMPTIRQLLEHSLFANTAAVAVESNLWKCSSSMQHKLNVTTLRIEERLKEEQRMVRSQKRLVKVQEIMSSEEEKKKQRKLKSSQETKDKFIKDRQLTLNGTNEMDCVATTTESVTTLPNTILLSNDNVPSIPKLVACSNGTSIPPPPPIDESRSALLGSICHFNKTSLKRTKVKN